MNDETPRRYRGSLLERAAEQYGYLRPATPPVVPISVPDEEPLTLTEIAPELPEVVAEVEAPAPVPQPAPQPRPAPRTGRREAPIDRIALREGGMLVPGDRVTAMAEEFRMVKRQLLLTARAVAGQDAGAADRARMILVCSAQPDEGKTFCAINLALSMAAEKDMEILLVDADFAKPDVLGRLGLPEGPGLLDALSGAVANVEDCIIDTDVPQLSVLPAGAHSNSDTELLASDRARAIVDGLARANPRRIVIFDSPPALAASPASVLAALVGQVMLVVRADRTSESDLRDAVNTLDGCEHIQLLLNSVSFQPGGRRFGSYYGEAGE
ncbi:exopolysaccharide/PEP-CTERM locus tyrosine autokinase [Sphingomonas naasensis]|uniref:AAA family ATPase n=1 Tax=Sphingomonas naasensis TaxID=1344951 RepID=UPI00141BECE5|nr:AAA family ATPase [Sphingomonas naasensis]NIJ20494.1 exopolysaccharide/PEP-CTERM locus tyrosine autokinase [Sphingomonas naasensis]